MFYYVFYQKKFNNSLLFWKYYFFRFFGYIYFLKSKYPKLSKKPLCSKGRKSEIRGSKMTPLPQCIGYHFYGCPFGGKILVQDRIDKSIAKYILFILQSSNFLCQFYFKCRFGDLKNLYSWLNSLSRQFFWTSGEVNYVG